MAIASLLQHWVDMLVEVRLPVLARTAAEIEALHADADAATPRSIAQVVLHDPLMTVKVLRYLQQHRNAQRGAEITTIAHALMMLGTARFLEFFRAEPSIEERLANEGDALRGVQAVMSRARHAALYAQDWAQRRHDVDPEEVMIAALLHDIAEALLWCFAPVLALEIAARQQCDRTLRSDDAQRAVLGFRLLDLQLELVKAWQLPDLLHMLMDETRMRSPRVQSVALATALARHSAHGWDDLALPDDFARIGELLGFTEQDAIARVAAVAGLAAAESDWYGVPAPALPVLPA